MAEVFAVRNTDSFTVLSSFTWKTEMKHQTAIAMIDTQPIQAGTLDSSTSNFSRANQMTETANSTHSGIHVRAICLRRSFDWARRA